MRKSTNLILAIDIGGTKVEAGLVDPRGNVIHSERSPMAARGSSQEGLRAVFAAVDALMKYPRAKAAKAIGVSVPGWVDSNRGVVISATNLPCWVNYPLARKIARRYKRPVRLANDANAASLAESVWGAGAGFKNMFYVTLGTGIGVGMVLNGALFAGTTGAAGEGGHITIDSAGPKCGCGKRGCIEVYASGTGVGRQARERAAENPVAGGRMLAMAGGFVDRVSAEIVSVAAGDGDPLANEILQSAADQLAIWLGGIIDLLEPEVIVIGGGFGRVMMRYAPRVREKLKIWAINPNRKRVKIVSAHFRAQSALVGAAALWLAQTPK
jgi:glucokinase